MLRFSFILLSFFCVFSCKHENNNGNKILTEIKIDFNDIENIDLNTLNSGQEICLSLLDDEPLGKINDVYIYKKNFFIRTQSGLYVFNKDGSLKSKIGQKGNGPGEYTHLNSFFVKEDSVYLYDAMSKKMYIYSLGGTFLFEKKLDEIYNEAVPLPNLIYPLHDSGYISKNTYGGDSRKINSYSILNNKFEIKDSIKNRFLKNGITTLNNFYSNADNILFWELMNDTIFSIDRGMSSYTPKYYINFKEKSIPLSVKKKDTYDAIEFSNKTENKNKYASVISNVYESDNTLTFTFIYQGNLHYANYDKKLKNISVYKLSYNNSNFNNVTFTDTEEGKLYFVIESLDNDCLLQIDKLAL